jgi:CHAD domain-containing protein
MPGPITGSTTGSTSHVELEHKYELEPGIPVPDLRCAGGVCAVGASRELLLDATYFDTDRLDLAARGVTLRRRSGGHDEGWHLKLPHPTERHQRTELSAPLDAATEEHPVPEPFAEPLAALLRGRPLRCVASVRTRRIERDLVDADDRSVAVVADDVVEAQSWTGDTVGLSSWHELEVELVSDDPEALAALDERMRAAGLHHSPWPSKLRHALGASGNGRPASGPTSLGAPALGPTTHELQAAPEEPTAAAFVRAHIRDLVDDLVSWDREARHDGPDAVHKLRVGCRRLRSDLATFRPYLPADRIAPLRAELRWLGAVLGDARDAEVQADRLSAALADLPVALMDGPVAERIDRHFHQVHTAAVARVQDALGSPRYAGLLDDLDDLTRPPGSDARTGASELRARVRHAARRVRRAARAVDQDADAVTRETAIHEVRKTAKRARYAAEAIAPVSGRRTRKVAQRMARLQDELGEHQDTVTARALLRDIAHDAHAAGESTFTYGVLHELEAEHSATILSRSGKTLRRALRSI